MFAIWYFTWLIFDISLALLIWPTFDAFLAFFAIRISASSR